VARASAGSGSTDTPQTATLGQLLELDLPFEDVPLPEYGGRVLRLHAVTGKERQRLAKLQREAGDQLDRIQFQHELIAAAAQAKPETIAELPSTVIDRLGDVALRLTGIESGDKADAALKATPSGDSGSPSPAALG
jgi:hypothetical protein